MLMTEPPPTLSRCGTASCVRLKAVETFQWKASLKDRSLVLKKGPGMLPPALFTTTSIRPSSAIARSTKACRPSRFERSPATTTARRPARRTCSATSSSWSFVRAPIATSAPTSAKARAIPAPMPRPAAVTIATLPSSRNLSRIIEGPPGPGLYSTAAAVAGSRIGSPASRRARCARSPAAKSAGTSGPLHQRERAPLLHQRLVEAPELGVRGGQRVEVVGPRSDRLLRRLARERERAGAVARLRVGQRREHERQGVVQRRGVGTSVRALEHGYLLREPPAFAQEIGEHEARRGGGQRAARR